MIASGMLGAIVGFLLGLLLCYWKQVKGLYENRDLISSGSNLASSAQDFIGQVREKL